MLRADDAMSVIDLLVVMSHPAPAGGVSGRGAGLRHCGGTNGAELARLSAPGT